MSSKPFQGSLETMSLPNILQWLSDSKKTGALVIKIRDEEKSIFLQDGVIISASSNLEKDRFGIVIIKKGYVTQSQVDELLKEGRETGKLLGKLCVEKGLIPEDDVFSILQEQTMGIIESLLHREEGTFEFKAGSNHMGQLDQIPLSIALQELFFASAGTREEWKRVYKTLGSLEAIPVTSTVQPGNISSLSEFQQFVISQCDGKKRVLDLFAEIDSKDFDICKVTAELVEKKWLEVTQPEDAENDEYQERIWQVHIMMEQKRYLRASLFLDEVITMFPNRAHDLTPLRNKVKEQIDKDMDRLLADDKIVLYHKAGFDQTKITGKTFGPQEWFLLSRIDGNTTLKDLSLMTGQPKNKTRFTIYSMIDAGAIDIKGREKETQRKIAPPVTRPTRTGPVKPVNPQNFSQKQTTNTVTDTGQEDKTPMNIDELDRIYKRYLKMNHYQILNASRESNQEQIRAEFVRLSRLYHPDMYDRENMDEDVQERLEELFSMVNHAYRVISNINSKEKYDKELWANAKSGAMSYTPSIEDKVFDMDKIVLKPKKSKKTPDKPAKTAVKTGATGTHKKVKSGEDSTPKPQPTGTHKKVTGVAPPKKELSKEKKFLNEGIELFKESNYKGAIESFENVLKHNSRNSKAYYYLSRCQQRQGGSSMDDALNNIKRALILDKENPQYFCQMGRVEIARENYNAAEKYLKTALAWDSESREAKYLLEKIKESRQTGFFKKLKRKKK